MPDDSTVVTSGRWLEFRRTAAGWEFVRRRKATGIVAVAAVTADDRMVLVEQFRPPMACRAIEIPAGLAGDEEAGESLEAAARRELLEETGFSGGAWRRLFTGPPSAGLSDEMVTFFLARSVVRTAAGGGVAGEDVAVHVVPRQGIATWLAERERAGLAIDPRVFVALHFAAGG